MNDNDVSAAVGVAVAVQDLHTAISVKVIEQGVLPMDALVGALTSAAQLSARIHGDPALGLEFINGVVDVLHGSVARDHVEGQQ